MKRTTGMSVVKMTVVAAVLLATLSASAWVESEVKIVSQLRNEAKALAAAGDYWGAVAKEKEAMTHEFTRGVDAANVADYLNHIATGSDQKMLAIDWLDECWQTWQEKKLTASERCQLESKRAWLAFVAFCPDIVRESKRRIESVGGTIDPYSHMDLALEGLQLYDDMETFPKSEVEIGFGKTLADFGVADTNVVHAKDFGWNETNATAAIKAAIESGATTVVIDDMGAPWYVGTIFPRSNQRLLFKRGVRMYCDLNLPNFNNYVMIHLQRVENVIVEGEGDVVLAKYPDYETRRRICTGEGESGIRFSVAKNVVVRNLTLSNHSKDGISFGDTSHHVWVENVALDCNYRQGCSIGSAYDVYFKNVDFINTKGGSPQAGFDHEPPAESGFDANVYFFDCAFTNNAGGGMIWSTSTISPVTTYTKRCSFDANDSCGILIYSRPGSYMQAGVKAPSKLVFEDCTGVSLGAQAMISITGCMLFDTAFRDCAFTEGARSKDKEKSVVAPVRISLDRDVGIYNELYDYSGTLSFENVSFTGWTNAHDPVQVLNEAGVFDIKGLSGTITFNGKDFDVVKYENYPIDEELGWIEQVDPATMVPPANPLPTAASLQPRCKPWTFCPWYNPAPVYTMYLYDNGAWTRTAVEGVYVHDWLPEHPAQAFAYQADTFGCRWARLALMDTAVPYTGYFEVPAGGRTCVVKCISTGLTIRDSDGNVVEPYEGDELNTIFYWRLVPKGKDAEIWSFTLPKATSGIGMGIRFFPPLSGIWADRPDWLPTNVRVEYEPDDTTVVRVDEGDVRNLADVVDENALVSRTLIKTGTGTLAYTQKVNNVKGTIRVEEGTLRLHNASSNLQVPALEIEDGASVVFTHGVYSSTFSSITLRGGTFEYNQLHRNLSGNARNVLDVALAHEQVTISKIAAYPSASGTPSVFRSERFQGAIEFFVDEGAELDVDCLFRADSRIRNSYVKTGAGELRFHNAPYTGTLFTHKEGTITFACPTAGFDREMFFSVAPGAVVRAADGSVLYQTVDPVNALLAEAGVWIDVLRCKGIDGVQFGSAGGVPNFGSAGGVLIHQAPASCPVFVANGINGLPALDFRYAGAGNGVRLVGAFAPDTSELSVYVVAQSHGFTAADTTHGKDASPVSCAPANGTSSAKGGFRFYLSAADSLSVAFNGENASKTPFVGVHDLAAMPYLMIAERTATTGRFRQYVGDGSETYEGTVEGQNWGACNIQNVGIGSAIKKDGGTWDAGGQFVGQIGEVLIFSRRLSAEEDEAVCGYLAKKWFNSTVEWAALPKSERAMTVDVPEGATSVLAVKSQPTDVPVRLTKVGAGVLQNASLLNDKVRFAVEEGRLAGPSRKRPISVAAIWLDPSDADTLTADVGGATLAAVANKGYLGGAFVPYSDDVSTHPSAGAVNGRRTLFFDGGDVLRYRGWTNALPREACIFVAKRRTAYKWGGAVLSCAREASDKKDEQSPGAIVMEDGDSGSKFSVKLGAVSVTASKETAGNDVVAIDYLTLSPRTGMFVELTPEHAPTNCPINVHATSMSDADWMTQNDLLQLGCRIAAGGVPDRDHWTGDIAELIILERQPSRSVTLEILEYLQKKWQGVGPGSATPPRCLIGNRIRPGFGVVLR